jgi:putative phosphoesterase
VTRSDPAAKPPSSLGPPGGAALRVGLVSDTHGLVDPKLAPLFDGCDLILHAGDVVKPPILAVLEAVAPLTTVRGNNDEGTPLQRLPETALVPLGDLTALVVHDLGPRERPKPPARGILARRRPEIVIHGHSHRPGAAVVGPTLFVNPGSAGPRRFSLPRAAAILTVRGRRARVQHFDLAGERAVPLGAPVEAQL